MKLPEQDLFTPFVEPVEERLTAALIASGWPEAAANGAAGVFNLCLMAGLLVAIIAAGAALQRTGRRAGQPEAPPTTRVTLALAAFVAVALFVWIVRYPGEGIYSLFSRFDHLAFCVCAGYALSAVTPAARMWTLSGVSGVLLGQHVGWIPLCVVTATALAGFAVAKAAWLQRPWPTALGQAIVLGLAFLACWQMRGPNLLRALETQGLFSFVLLRQISFVVEARRGLPADLGRYLCYMFFYPSSFGSSEIYSEFSPRNLSGTSRYDYRQAVSKIIRGLVQAAIALRIPMSFDTVLSAETAARTWPLLLILFVRSSLFMMGFWAVVEGVGRLYGVEMRPNFSGILRCENPSQFWRSWRATMTNWLVHYVYIPLGGNRRWQARNIFAAFAVTTVWHWMGIPFLASRVGAVDFVPIAIWGLVNCLAVVGYMIVRARSWRVLPDGTPPLLRRATKILLTACLGTLTVSLLGFAPQYTEHLSAFIRTVVGLRF